MRRPCWPPANTRGCGRVLGSAAFGLVGAAHARVHEAGARRAVHDGTPSPVTQGAIDTHRACHSICVSPGWSSIGSPLGRAEGSVL